MAPTGTLIVLGTNSRLILIPSSSDITTSGEVCARIGALLTGIGLCVIGSGVVIGNGCIGSNGSAGGAGVVADTADIGSVTAGVVQALRITNTPMSGIATIRVTCILKTPGPTPALPTE